MKRSLLKTAGAGITVRPYIIHVYYRVPVLKFWVATQNLVAKPLALVRKKKKKKVGYKRYEALSRGRSFPGAQII